MGDKPKVISISSRTSTQQPASKSTIDVTASVARRDPPLALEELQVAVARTLNFGTLRESRHSGKDRSYRNVSQDDMLHILSGEWMLAKPPEYDEVHRNWKYTLAGQDIDGDELTLAIAIDTDENRITVITKY